MDKKKVFRVFWIHHVQKRGSKSFNKERKFTDFDIGTTFEQATQWLHDLYGRLGNVSAFSAVDNFAEVITSTVTEVAIIPPQPSKEHVKPQAFDQCLFDSLTWSETYGSKK